MCIFLLAPRRRSTGFFFLSNLYLTLELQKQDRTYREKRVREAKEEGGEEGGRRKEGGRGGRRRGGGGERESTSSEVAIATGASASDLCLEKFAPNTI